MKHVLSYKLYENIDTLKLSKKIGHGDLDNTLFTIEEVIFPVLYVKGFGTDATLIKDDLPDFIKIKLDTANLCELYNISREMSMKKVYDILRQKFPVFTATWFRGEDVVSIGYPIANNPEKGYVKIDFVLDDPNETE